MRSAGPVPRFSPLIVTFVHGMPSFGEMPVTRGGCRDRDIVLAEETRSSYRSNLLKEKQELVPAEASIHQECQRRTCSAKPSRLLHTRELGSSCALAHWPHLLNMSDPGHELVRGGESRDMDFHVHRKDRLRPPELHLCPPGTCWKRQQGGRSDLNRFIKVKERLHSHRCMEFHFVFVLDLA